MPIRPRVPATILVEEEPIVQIPGARLPRVLSQPPNDPGPVPQNREQYLNLYQQVYENTGTGPGSGSTPLEPIFPGRRPGEQRVTDEEVQTTSIARPWLVKRGRYGLRRVSAIPRFSPYAMFQMTLSTPFSSIGQPVDGDCYAVIFRTLTRTNNAFQSRRVTTGLEEEDQNLDLIQDCRLKGTFFPFGAQTFLNFPRQQIFWPDRVDPMSQTMVIDCPGLFTSHSTGGDFGDEIFRSNAFSLNAFSIKGEPTNRVSVPGGTAVSYWRQQSLIRIQSSFERIINDQVTKWEVDLP